MNDRALRGNAHMYIRVKSLIRAERSTCVYIIQSEFLVFFLCRACNYFITRRFRISMGGMTHSRCPRVIFEVTGVYTYEYIHLAASHSLASYAVFRVYCIFSTFIIVSFILTSAFCTRDSRARSFSRQIWLSADFARLDEGSRF